MKFLFRFLIACFHAAMKPTAHFIGNIVLFIWHGKLPKLSAHEMIVLEWETTYFYCGYQMSGSKSPYYVYKTFQDFVLGKREYVFRTHRTVFEHQNADKI